MQRCPRDVTAPVANLGRLSGPTLVFGGPYSNLEATRALLAEAARKGIPPERTICTGDVVAYAADPEATAAAIRAAGVRVVMGNCEESLGVGAEDCGCGFAPGSICDRLSAAWYAYADAHLTPEARRWMAALPRRIDFSLGGATFAVVHGSLSRINRFVYASTGDAEFLAEFDAAGTDAVIGGHCGLPFTRTIAGRLWHNAGVIGMPANDGTPRVWYSTLAPEPGGVEITLHALDYDHRAAAAKMRGAGLPGEYWRAIETGLWDNDDILPPAEKAAKGRALQPATWHWRRPASKVETAAARVSA
ncbi:MAG TPA: metallophosphoesterase family protein [Candidatus Cybelea sp.]|nr:metallophosphoesterase family protein [Candidatus Cybelea sp.]